MVRGAASIATAFIHVQRTSPRFGVEAREMIKEDIALLGEIFMPAGIDYHKITFLILGFGVSRSFLPMTSHFFR